MFDETSMTGPLLIRFASHHLRNERQSRLGRIRETQFKARSLRATPRHEPITLPIPLRNNYPFTAMPKSLSRLPASDWRSDCGVTIDGEKRWKGQRHHELFIPSFDLMDRLIWTYR
jgi:hypothetical protein